MYDEKLVKLHKCGRCGVAIESDECRLFYSAVCAECARLYPRSLLKATCDPFDYALRLSTGEIIRFNQAEIHGEYVELRVFSTLTDNQDFHEAFLGESNETLPFSFARGIDVRADAIVWCADAPNGS